MKLINHEDVVVVGYIDKISTHEGFKNAKQYILELKDTLEVKKLQNEVLNAIEIRVIIEDEDVKIYEAISDCMCVSEDVTYLFNVKEILAFIQKCEEDKEYDLINYTDEFIEELDKGCPTELFYEER